MRQFFWSCWEWIEICFWLVVFLPVLIVAFIVFSYYADFIEVQE